MIVDIKINADDRIRIDGSYSGLNNFIDVAKADYAGIELTLFAGFQYIEIRKKGDLVKVFTFPKKSIKKDFDFNGWEDAEVVYSVNEQIMHK